MIGPFLYFFNAFSKTIKLYVFKKNGETWVETSPLITTS
jgi:hypothetical protein